MVRVIRICRKRLENGFLIELKIWLRHTQPEQAVLQKQLKIKEKKKRKMKKKPATSEACMHASRGKARKSRRKFQ